MQTPVEELVVLGLGSNVGTTELKLQVLRNTVAAIDALDSTRVSARSSVYQNPPWGYEQQDDFLNAAVSIHTTLNPLDLLHHLKTIEKNLGRQPTFRWGPRLIDIDIILYGNRTVHLPELVIPHPHFLERPFVLVPLLEAAPDATLPDGRAIHSIAPAGNNADLVRVGAL